MLRPKIFFLALHVRCYKNLQKKFDCQNRLVFTTNFNHNTEFTQQSTKAGNKPNFVFPTDLHMREHINFLRTDTKHTAVHVAHVNNQH